MNLKKEHVVKLYLCYLAPDLDLQSLPHPRSRRLTPCPSHVRMVTRPAWRGREDTYQTCSFFLIPTPSSPHRNRTSGVTCKNRFTQAAHQAVITQAEESTASRSAAWLDNVSNSGSIKHAQDALAKKMSR